VTPETATEGGRSPDRFSTTRWSMILACADSTGGEAMARKALTELCKTYWRPIFSFICRRGYSIPDAQDLTQDFFLMILEGDFLKRADPNRGRFRSLLLKAVQNFLADDKIRKRARKRGGDMKFVSWDEWIAEAPSRLSIPAHEAEIWPAEKIYDVRWAATAVEHALRQLGEECEARGRRRVFDVLSDCLAADRQDVSYQKLSKSLGIPVASVKRLVHQLRVRYRDLLRKEVAQTVEKPEDVDDELRYLCAALAGATT
jgi:DNA-directed RNA polymerase specialized sigma24 family protein